MVVDRHEGGGDHVIELPVFVLGELANGEEAREIRMCPPSETRLLRVHEFWQDWQARRRSRHGECLSQSEDLLPSESSFRPHSGNGLKKRGNH